MEELESFEVEIGFSVDEWQNIKRAYEHILEKTLDKDQIIDLVMTHCREEMVDWVARCDRHRLTGLSS